MPFGFFSRLHFRSRDAILEGAMEAERILVEGPDENTFRTETLNAVEAEGNLRLPTLPAPSASSDGQNEPSSRAQTKKPASSGGTGSKRRPRRTAKTEAMFDVNSDES